MGFGERSRDSRGESSVCVVDTLGNQIFRLLFISSSRDAGVLQIWSEGGRWFRSWAEKNPRRRHSLLCATQQVCLFKESCVVAAFRILTAITLPFDSNLNTKLWLFSRRIDTTVCYYNYFWLSRMPQIIQYFYTNSKVEKFCSNMIYKFTITKFCFTKRNCTVEFSFVSTKKTQIFKASIRWSRV